MGVGLPSPSLVSSVATQLLSGPLPEELWVGGLAPHCSLSSLRFREENTFRWAESFNPGLPFPNSTTVEGRVPNVEIPEGGATGTCKTAQEGSCCCGETEPGASADRHQGLGIVQAERLCFQVVPWWCHT